MSKLRQSPLAKVELDLHNGADVDRKQVEADLQFLAHLGPATGKNNPLAMVLGLTFDTAPVLEQDSTISALYVTLVRVQEPNQLLDLLLKHVPILGAEIIFALSEGFHHIRFAQSFDPAPSFHTLLREGKISNHDRLAIRGKALATLQAFESE